MRRLIPAVPVLIAAAVIGCGGDHRSGSNTSGNTGATDAGTNATTGTGTTTGILAGSTTGVNSANRYVGTYRGTYETRNALPAQHGTLAITIQRGVGSTLGVAITGTATDSVNGSATVTGVIFDFNPSQSHLYLNYEDGTSDDLRGAPTLAAEGGLVGPVGLDRGGLTFPTDLDLSPVTQ